MIEDTDFDNLTPEEKLWAYLSGAEGCIQDAIEELTDLVLPPNVEREMRDVLAQISQWKEVL